MRKGLVQKKQKLPAILFLTPVLNSQEMKKLCDAIHKKYKNQAGMSLTPPHSSFKKMSSIKLVSSILTMFFVTSLTAYLTSMPTLDDKVFIFVL